MKTIFNKAITILTILSLSLQSAYGQPVEARTQDSVPQLKLQSSQQSQNDSQSEFVMSHTNISLQIGTLTIDTVFVYKDEAAPYQGYLIKLRDYMSIESLVTSLNEGCDVVSDALVQECKSQLNSCQSDCDHRVTSLIREKDSLKLRLKTAEGDLRSEQRSKYIWSTISIVAGVSLGIIVYKVAN